MNNPNADGIVRSINSAEKPRRAGIRTVRMDTVSPQSIEWLWRPHFALGKISVIAGHPGLGKSLLSMSFAGHVTTGRKWADGTPCPEGSVVLVSGEDDPGDTLRPRLDAAGARVDRVHYLRAVAEVEGERAFSLADVVYLEELMRELGDCKLIVIDPVSAYLGGVDSHKNADVRALLTPLAQMAADHRVAVVCVSHLNKGAGEAIGRVTGSLAIVAAARAAYAVVRCKEDETRRLVLPIKNNLGNDTGGMSYRIAAERDVPYVTWDRDPVRGVTADEALAPTSGESTVSDAIEFLREMLADESMPVKELKAEATAAGISWRTMERAKAELGLVAQRFNGERRGEGYWAWGFKEHMNKPASPASPYGGLEENGSAMRLPGVSDHSTPSSGGVDAEDEEVVDI